MGRQKLRRVGRHRAIADIYNQFINDNVKEKNPFGDRGLWRKNDATIRRWYDLVMGERVIIVDEARGKN